VNDERLPLKHTGCKFGEWYHGDGMRQLGHIDIYRDLAGSHEMLYAGCEQIHTTVSGKHSDKAAHVKLDDFGAIFRTLFEQMELREQEVEARVA